MPGIDLYQAPYQQWLSSASLTCKHWVQWLAFSAGPLLQQALSPWEWLDLGNWGLPWSPCVSSVFLLIKDIPTFDRYQRQWMEMNGWFGGVDHDTGSTSKCGQWNRVFNLGSLVVHQHHMEIIGEMQPWNNSSDCFLNLMWNSHDVKLHSHPPRPCSQEHAIEGPYLTVNSCPVVQHQDGSMEQHQEQYLLKPCQAFRWNSMEEFSPLGSGAVPSEELKGWPSGDRFWIITHISKCCF